MITAIFLDGFFAALAAIGFAYISNPPKNAYIYCAIIAAVGHSLRFCLASGTIFSMHLIVADAIAAFVIGCLAVIASPLSKFPAETCLFPALLPMIPGMNAYRTVEALILCLKNSDEAIFQHYFYLFSSNAFMCIFIILGMVISSTIPIFVLKKISFQATR